MPNKLDLLLGQKPSLPECHKALKKLVRAVGDASGALMYPADVARPPNAQPCSDAARSTTSDASSARKTCPSRPERAAGASLPRHSRGVLPGETRQRRPATTPRTLRTPSRGCGRTVRSAPRWDRMLTWHSWNPETTPACNFCAKALAPLRKLIRALASHDRERGGDVGDRPLVGRLCRQKRKAGTMEPGVVMRRQTARCCARSASPTASCARQRRWRRPAPPPIRRNGMLDAARPRAARGARRRPPTLRARALRACNRH